MSGSSEKVVIVLEAGISIMGEAGRAKAVGREVVGAWRGYVCVDSVKDEENKYGSKLFVKKTIY